jgi:hypothetical protein
MAVAYYGWQFYQAEWYPRIAILALYLALVAWSRVASDCSSIWGAVFGAVLGALMAVLYVVLQGVIPTKAVKYNLKSA